ncbi:hypothetical protein BDN72DRAFT_944352 [Pluteus cervinus]|uniref:Uncharacterized protein n=1 Tax=Pluteus cervinus TaxID=181527 RepID=A0ACD3A1P1_9AGAR|nr:hypothetical protein BDN72DRAFT_944352 [Pluteus cervinus]
MDNGVLDLTNIPTFRPSEWIMTGKTFPSNPPLHVKEARDCLLFIPGPFQRHLPAANLPISQLIQWSMNPTKSTLVGVKPSQWFQMQPPNTMPEVALTRRPPAVDVIAALDSALGQAWLDGAQSIVDPRYNNGQELLPLWILGFWKTVAENVEIQKKWRQSAEWLEGVGAKTKRNEPQTFKMVQAVKNILSKMGWATNLAHLRGNLHPKSVQLLLGTEWLDDDLIDSMMEELSAEISNLPGRVVTLVATLQFSKEIQRNSCEAVFDPKLAAVLHRYEMSIKQRGFQRIYFPAMVNKHWIACCIDFEAKTLAYGDGFRDNCPITEWLLKDTATWLQSRFKIEVRMLGNSLRHAKQDDTFSCGMIAVNTIEVNAFNRAQWSAQTANLERIKWFLRLTRHIENFPNHSPHLNTDTGHTVALSTVDSAPPHLKPVKRQRLDVSDLLSAPLPVQVQTSPAATIKETTAKPSSSCRSTGVGKESKRQNLLTSWLTKGETNNTVKPAAATYKPLRPPVAVKPKSSIVKPKPHTQRAEPSQPKQTKGPTFRQGTVLEDLESDGDAEMVDAASDGRGQLAKSNSGTVPRAVLVIKTNDAEVGPRANRKRKAVEDDGGEDLKVEVKKKAGKVENITKKDMESLGKDFPPSEADPKKYKRFKDKILTKDRHAWFSPKTIRLVRHSKCSAEIRVKAPYDTTRWTKHLENCEKEGATTKPKLSTVSLHDSLGNAPRATTSDTTSDNHTLLYRLTPDSHDATPTKPCPGLTAADDERIAGYIYHAGAQRGGGKDLLSFNKSDQAFSELDPKIKDELRLQQRHTQRWEIDKSNSRIFALDCSKFSSDNHGSPCDKCFAILQDGQFKRLLSKPVPKEENFKFVPNIHRDKAGGELYARHIGLKELVETPNAKDTPCVRYAKRVLAGDFKNDGHKIFAAMIDVLNRKKDREEQGKGMQNFSWPPEYKEFAHQLNIISPQTYRLFTDHIPGPTTRTFRNTQARQPRFPQTICDESFELVNKHLEALGFTGPCALGCDDTKLLPSLRLDYDSKKEHHFLVGASTGPVRVLDPDNMKGVLAELREKKATKLRVFTLTPALPKVTPLIVAALPIPNNFNVATLYPLTLQVLTGLITRGVKVVSYSCDGTETERKVQQQLIDEAKTRISTTIHSPVPGGADVTLVIPIIEGQGVAMVQDSKHGLKTSRNNLVSGTHTITLGNFVANYDQLFDLANHTKTPLFSRDVRKVDKQDDNAATRVFCADLLALAIESDPQKYAGLIVYLFIFGELIDAYQNRSIPHSERVKMVLRTHHFLHGWMSALSLTGHAKRLHAPSREALDIFQRLIHGFLNLIILHRDHLDSLTAFIPWLHSTEACEHLFGEARRIIKEFTMLDFLQMIPKLRIMLQRAIQKQRLQDSREKAAGYNHTLYDLTGLNELNLATFPTEQEIKTLNQIAFDEADSLLDFIGYQPDQLRGLIIHEQQAQRPDVDDGDDDDSNISNYEDEMGQMEELLQLIEEDENAPGSASRRSPNDRIISNLTCATFSLMAEEMGKVFVSSFAPDKISPSAYYGRISETVGQCTNQEEDEAALLEYSEAQAAINRAFAIAQNCPSTAFGQVLTSNPLVDASIGESADLTRLIEARRQHQTATAASSVRMPHSNPKEPEPEADETEEVDETELTKRELIRQFHDILRQESDHEARSAGVDRGTRWKTAGGYDPSPAGNSGNARAIATIKSNKAATKRNGVFKKLKVPDLSPLGGGGISVVRPLKRGDYLLVMIKEQVYAAKVLAIYTRTAGKGVSNASVDSVPGVTKTSYVSTQIFEYYRQRKQFSSRTSLSAALGTFQFAHLRSNDILTLISQPRYISETNFFLQEQDGRVLRSVLDNLGVVNGALKELRKREPKEPTA